ncbi:CRISPR-associated endonuclease Cas2 [Dolosigranulum pigrum]
MSYRFMRILVLFDLPMLTSQDKKEYRQFRKFLLTNGFIMMQQSVYSKIALNGTVARTVVKNVRENKPNGGLVQLLTITEKQFNKMEFIVGQVHTDMIDSDERMLIF